MPRFGERIRPCCVTASSSDSACGRQDIWDGYPAPVSYHPSRNNAPRRFSCRCCSMSASGWRPRRCTRRCGVGWIDPPRRLDNSVWEYPSFGATTTQVRVGDSWFLFHDVHSPAIGQVVAQVCRTAADSHASAAVQPSTLQSDRLTPQASHPGPCPAPPPAVGDPASVAAPSFACGAPSRSTRRWAGLCCRSPSIRDCCPWCDDRIGAHRPNDRGQVVVRT